MTANELKNQIEELQMVTISLQREVQEQAKLLYERDQRIDQLKKQLAIAVGALKAYRDEHLETPYLAGEALKQIEEVK